MKQNNKIYLLLIASLLITFSAMAQQTKVFVHGKVTAKGDKLPIIGASVIEYDDNNRILNGATTDFDGNYSLKISGGTGTKITFNYIGYKPETRTVSSTTTINVEK